ncbi:thiamine pyrophosphate-dependent enzyme [Streptomyces sp. ME18-1-4]|uniref:thiamine pyrophosphate-dependent enzyme n=1 Tax=Streptomyces sp. ME18-1-4 TaxID=3028685 RepID=UPI0029AACBA0|nr:thiamine pyrophosphate-dependent enzyme [Streptomyces sp. ME18-1-4]MDX3240608.1 thiamine pyrophosphate-dependent enzyme [Streptomyces sp. ME18-1-4]
MSIPIGTHALHGVGTAMAAPRLGEDSLTVAFIGDGATSEGVTAIRCSAFRYSARNADTDRLVRFSFCKPADVMREATSRLTGKWRA